MGIFSKGLKKYKEKKAAKYKYKAENILVGMMQQHIYRYPHSYFIRKAPKNLKFKRR